MRQGSMRSIIESNTEVFLRRRLTGGEKKKEKKVRNGTCWLLLEVTM